MDLILPYLSFHDIKKILIVKLKHVGDVLLTTPCIRVLHEAFPSAQISILVDEDTDALLKNHPLLTEIICFPRSLMRRKSLQRIQREIEFISSIRRRHFDFVVDLTSADRAAWIAWLSGARYRLAYDPQKKGFWGKRFLYTHLAPYPTDPDLHEVKKNLGVLEYLGLPCAFTPLELHLTERDLSQAKLILDSLNLPKKVFGDTPNTRKRFAIVHPTSRWLFKCWEDERFAALVDWLQTSAQLPVIMTCGPNPQEQERAHRILAYCTTHPKTLFGILSLLEWAAFVRQACLFVGVDSAPMHIAASQGVPTLAFFGPTGFQNWRPWAVQHTVLVHDCPCSRDRQPHCDWSRVRACMHAITLDEAKKALEPFLL